MKNTNYSAIGFTAFFGIVLSAISYVNYFPSSKTTSVAPPALLISPVTLPTVSPSPLPTPTHSPNTILVQDKKVSLEKEAAELGNYVILQMKIVNAKGSNLRMQVLARQIVSVSMEIFDNQEQRKQFVTLIAIESKFDPKAKSHVGAAGLSQVMPQYAKEFASKCGIQDLDITDIEIPEINLTIGACRFRALLEIFKGNVSLSLVGYNAGANSNQIKQLQEFRNLSSVETSSYISKFSFLQEKTKADTKAGISDEKDEQ